MDEKIRELEAALRNAHAAGDAAAARRFADEIIKLRGAVTATPSTAAASATAPAVAASPARAPIQQPPGLLDDDSVMMIGSVLQRDNVPKETWQSRLKRDGFQPEQQKQILEAHGLSFTPDFSTVQSGSSTVSPAELDPRGVGVALGERVGPLGAALQGAGSMAFGVGTPLTAAAEFVARAIPGGEPAVSPGEALEIARGIREGAYEAHPWAYRAGGAAGLVGSGAAVRKGLSYVPSKVASVFTLQSGQTAKNIAKLGATGAAAAGVTEVMTEGVDGVPLAMGVGAVAGPVGAKVVKSAVSGVAATPGYVRAATQGNLLGAPGRMLEHRAVNKAYEVIAKKLGASPDAVQAAADEWIALYGKAPSLLEIGGTEFAERLGVISRSTIGGKAGRVFQQAEEAAALERPGMVSEAIRGGRATTTVPEQQAQMSRITERVRGVFGQGATETRVAERASKVTDVVMRRIGGHRVRLSDDMKDVVTSPDAQAAMPAATRRLINDVIDQGETLGSVDMSVQTWDSIRRALGNRASAALKGNSPDYAIYANLRNKVRDYVSERVREYGRIMKKYGKYAEIAENIPTGRQAATLSARQYADLLSASPEAKLGGRLGLREWLKGQLNSTPQSAERVMKRLARDNRLRANIREVLSDDESLRLEALGNVYGVRLDITEGLKVGQRVMRTSDADMFEDAVRNARATPGGARGVEEGTVATIAGAAEKGPAGAVRVARDLVESPGFVRNIEMALDAPRASRLERIGATTWQATRSLGAASPPRTEAQAQAQQAAQEVQQIFAGMAVASGRASGSLIANFGRYIVDRIRMSPRAAERIAQLATKPESAPEAIAYLRKAGVTSEEILRWYRDAAVAGGIIAGSR